MKDNKIEKLSQSDLSNIVKLLESHPPIIRTFREGNFFGMFIGGLTLLGGFISSLLGLAGSVEWIFNAETISMKLLNASPSALFSVIGFIIMLKYKPRIKSEIEIKVKETQEQNKKEISVRYESRGSSPLSSPPPYDIFRKRFP